MKPELWMSKASGMTVVESVVTHVPTPSALEAGRLPSERVDG